MKRQGTSVLNLLLFILTLGFAGGTSAAASPAQPPQWQLQSPDGRIQLTLELTEQALQYRVDFANKPVLRFSKLGFALKNQPDLQADLATTQVLQRQADSSWQPVWGQKALIRDQFNEISLQLQETTTTARQLHVTFRAYNDGIAFRYHLPAQPAFAKLAVQDLVVTNELTEFAFARNFSAWWIPAYRNQRFEYQYLNSALSSVDVAHTPITLIDQGVAVAVHEAALVNYASMTLRNITDNHLTFTADLVPWANGDKAYLPTPFSTPWRTIQIASSELALLESDLILNLNDPPAADINTAYIKPGKYIGIWWEMHIGEKDWSPGAKQGATTERAKAYIDFASQHDIDGVLVEGWNQGWEGDWWQRPPTFSFTRPVAGFDIQQVAAYAKAKGVRLIGHHETAAGVDYYEQQMADAFALYQQLGVNSVKMGYVGTRINGKEWHHGQYMVQHFSKLTDIAARHGVMVNAHETVKDTGLSRTHPNLMTRECVRGMEYNGGSPDSGNLPNHTVIIPFTRGLAGPIDFTPGIFNFNYQKNRPNNRVPSTLANQLALYVTLYSPLQMAADLPENYQNHPAFAFIDAVPTDWQQSKALQGSIGQYLVMARQDKNSARWFLGATTNEQARDLTVKLDFLSPGQKYRMTSYLDAADAHWETKPMAYQIITTEVVAGQSIALKLAAGGGAAVELTPLTNQITQR